MKYQLGTLLYHDMSHAKKVLNMRHNPGQTVWTKTKCPRTKNYLCPSTFALGGRKKENPNDLSCNTILIVRAAAATTVSSQASTMSSIADRRATKRAAASQAEGKIKKTLEEINGWSASDVSSESSDVCRRLSDFDDLQGHEHKKARKESSTEDTKKSVESEASSKEEVPDKDPAKKEEATTESKQHKDSETTNSTELSSSSSSSESSTESPAENTADALKSYREQRAEERNQHSTGPMILSRRLSWKLSKADPSPAYSPISATRLLFTPAAANAKTNRAH